MYALERLTAPHPDWDSAIIYAKGVQPMGVEAGKLGIRWIRAEQTLVIDGSDVEYPFDPPQQPRQTSDGRVIPGYPGSIADSTTYMHEEEIVRVDFFSNVRKRVVKTVANLPQNGEGKLLTAEGETQDVAAERERLVEENKSGKIVKGNGGGMKSV